MSEFSHLKNKLLAEQVEDEIYHYILDTPLEPGAKLPNEFELGEKFGVGRSTVREAVKLLSSKGIVEVRRGSGTYVVTTAKGLSDPLNLRSVQDKNALAFALVEEGDLIEIDIPARKLNIIGIKGERKPLEEIDAVLAQRRAAWKPKPRRYKRGTLRLFSEHAASPMKGAYLEYND